MSKLTQAEIDAIFAQANQEEGGQVQPAVPAASAGSSRPAEPPAPTIFPALPTFQQTEIPPTPAAGAPSIGLLANVELDVTVRLGQTRRSIREILSLGHGAVLELDSLAGETVDILVNGRLVGKGEVVVVEENYGVRIVELTEASGGKTA